MVSSSVLTGFGVLALASAAAAPVKTDSPTNVVYRANFNKTVTGSLTFSSTNGSVLVGVALENLPLSGGPFIYHIHEKTVPANGNCTATLGHFNPYNGTTTALTAAEMEVGDLSGKHGSINGTSYHASYIDEYLSLNPDDESYFANLSIVVHYANTTRIACANITQDSIQVSDGAAKTIGGVAAWLPLAAGAAALLM